MKEQILKLREEGKTYNQIVKLLGCSKSLISYYCKEDSKEIMKISKQNRKLGIYVSKSIEKKLCENCSNEVTRSATKYCSHECSTYKRNSIKYLDYIDNQEKYQGYKRNLSWLKKHFLIDQKNKCDICSIKNEWNNKPLMFVLDHIDGDACNNFRNNLRLLCSNCDSQLDTYKAKNIGKSTRKYKPYVI